MITTVLALLCSTLGPCREEVVTEADIGIGLGCLVAEGQALTEWKEHSIYAGARWEIRSVRCAAGGGYRVKEST